MNGGNNLALLWSPWQQLQPASAPAQPRCTSMTSFWSDSIHSNKSVHGFGAYRNKEIMDTDSDTETSAAEINSTEKPRKNPEKK